MELAELLAAAVLGALASQAASRGAHRYWRRADRARREEALRHLDEVTRQLQALKHPPRSAGGRWQSAAYRRYFVPAGLHLEQARRILRERHQNMVEDTSTGCC
jgi:hypothetical protein